MFVARLFYLGKLLKSAKIEGRLVQARLTVEKRVDVVVAVSTYN